VGSLAEAESIALSVNKFAKARSQSAEMAALRLDSVRRLVGIMIQSHKESLAISTAKEELDSWKNPAPAQAYQLIDLSKRLASYFVQHGDLKSADEYLNQIKQLKPILKAEQRSELGRNG